MAARKPYEAFFFKWNHMNNIDVHILTMRNFPSYGNYERIEEVVKILEDEPVNIHIVDVETPGHEGLSRVQALSHGTAEWVGWVDPDDVVIPGMYKRMLEESENYDFVWTKEIERVFGYNNNPVQDKIITLPHHMFIIKRKLLNFNEIARMRYGAVRAFHRFARSGKYINEIGYIWNHRLDSDCERLTRYTK